MKEKYIKWWKKQGDIKFAKVSGTQTKHMQPQLRIIPGGRDGRGAH